MELAEYGLRMEHIDETMVRITMRVLSAGHRIAFGGTFNNPKAPLTKKMVDTTLRWVKLKDEDGPDRKSHDYLNTPSQWPLVNYNAYPFYNDLEPQQEANWIGFCQIVRVPDKNPMPAELQNLKPAAIKLQPEVARRNADALTRMRKISTRCSDLRIVWGGKVNKAMGWMPGILEEVGFSLQQQKPILILGALGGCARLIADYLIKPGADWPRDLSLESCADPGRDTVVTTEKREQLQQRLEGYKTLLKNYRERLHGTDASIDGVHCELLIRALNANLGTTEILFYVDQFIREVQASKPIPSTATQA
jgi:hypothetical protein